MGSFITDLSTPNTKMVRMKFLAQIPHEPKLHFLEARNELFLIG